MTLVVVTHLCNLIFIVNLHSFARLRIRENPINFEGDEERNTKIEVPYLRYRKIGPRDIISYRKSQRIYQDKK